MVSKDFLKSAFLGSLLAIAALPTIALNNPAHAAENEYGWDTDPHCSFSVKKNVMKAGKNPTGIVTSIKGWDLEIYENPEKKSWVLLGKRNEEGASKELCFLTSGIEDYAQEKWYQAFFK